MNGLAAAAVVVGREREAQKVMTVYCGRRTGWGVGAGGRVSAFICSEALRKASRETGKDWATETPRPPNVGASLGNARLLGARESWLVRANRKVGLAFQRPWNPIVAACGSPRSHGKQILGILLSSPFPSLSLP